MIRFREQGREVLAVCLIVFGFTGCGTVKPVSNGESFYRAHCADCHRLILPATYTAKEWPVFVDRMAVKARLTEEDIKVLKSYLQENAKEEK